MGKTIYKAIGLMSGTSIDGVDAALIATDGINHVESLAFLHLPYTEPFRERLRDCFGRTDRDAMVVSVEKELTERHAEAVLALIEEHKIDKASVDLVGFHGQTLFHKPQDGITIQIGDGALLAALTGISVVNDFRTADVKAGGQGAPLVPLYHKALANKLQKPIALVNIGGVSNVTWIGGDADDSVYAFDLGPGNALIDDWMLTHADQPFDKGGAFAAKGHPDKAFVEAFRKYPYFDVKPPKSLDRNAFNTFIPHGKTPEDGAATLTLMTAQAIVDGFRHVPCMPSAIYICGGGRHNETLCGWIHALSGVPVLSVGLLGWNGDAVEAEAFAYLAVRSVLGLPLSMPLTTGVAQPKTGGVLHKI